MLLVEKALKKTIITPGTESTWSCLEPLESWIRSSWSKRIFACEWREVALVNLRKRERKENAVNSVNSVNSCITATNNPSLLHDSDGKQREQLLYILSVSPSYIPSVSNFPPSLSVQLISLPISDLISVGNPLEINRKKRCRVEVIFLEVYKCRSVEVTSVRREPL